LRRSFSPPSECPTELLPPFLFVGGAPHTRFPLLRGRRVRSPSRSFLLGGFGFSCFLFYLESGFPLFDFEPPPLAVLANAVFFFPLFFPETCVFEMRSLTKQTWRKLGTGKSFFLSREPFLYGGGSALFLEPPPRERLIRYLLLFSDATRISFPLHGWGYGFSWAYFLLPHRVFLGLRPIPPQDLV